MAKKMWFGGCGLGFLIYGFVQFLANTPTPLPADTVAPDASAPFWLKGPEIREAVVGKSLASVTKEGLVYTLTYNTDGTGIDDTKGLAREPFTWEVKGDVLCVHAERSGTDCDKVRGFGTIFDFYDNTSHDFNNRYTVH